MKTEHPGEMFNHSGTKHIFSAQSGFPARLFDVAVAVLEIESDLYPCGGVKQNPAELPFAFALAPGADGYVLHTPDCRFVMDVGVAGENCRDMVFGKDIHQFHLFLYRIGGHCIEIARRTEKIGMREHEAMPRRSPFVGKKRLQPPELVGSQRPIGRIEKNKQVGITIVFHPKVIASGAEGFPVIILISLLVNLVVADGRKHQLVFVGIDAVGKPLQGRSGFVHIVAQQYGQQGRFPRPERQEFSHIVPIGILDMQVRCHGEGIMHAWEGYLLGIEIPVREAH